MDALRKLVLAITRGFFRLFYELEIEGLEKIPPAGPIIVAANHVNYFDAPLLLAFMPRRLHFVATSAAFGIPVWTALLRLFGTIPVVRGKADASAIKASLQVLDRGLALGIFPEGTFTHDGHVVPAKLGTAHLAIRSGAPVVPVSISGAFRSWPRMGPAKRRLPRPWMLRVKVHDPLWPGPRAAPSATVDKDEAAALTERIVASLNRTLEPALRAEARVAQLVAEPAPPVRLYELFPLFLTVGAALVMGARTAWFSDPASGREALLLLAGFAALAVSYFAYLEADRRAGRQTVVRRAFRTASPFLFLAVYYPLLVRFVSLTRPDFAVPQATGPGLLGRLAPPVRWIAVDWLYTTYLAFLPYLLVSLRYYHFNRYLLLQRFTRGLLLSAYAALLLILFVPAVGGGFRLAIPLSDFGFFSSAVSRVHLSRLALASFPAVPVTLVLYCAAFDLLHHRRHFWALLLPAASAVASPILLRGYPPAAVAACLAAVGLVLAYMRLVPMKAHDGRSV